MLSGSGSHPELFASAPATRRGRRQRLLLLALPLLSLFFVAAGEYGRSGTEGAGKGGIVAALKGPVIAALTNPLALFARRSPGRRGPGAQHLTKAAAKPHERVLAGVRQRDLAPGLAPAPGAPVMIDIAPEAVAAPTAAPEGAADTAPVNGSLVPTPTTPIAFPGFPGAATDNFGGPGTPPGGTTPGGPGGNGTPPGGPSGPGGTDTPPAGPGDITTPSGGSDTLPIGPGDTDTPPNSPGTTMSGTPPPIEVPEPATWLMMIVGLLAVILTVRRGAKSASNA